MLDARVDVGDGGGDGGGGETTHVGWREVDRRMRKVARRRAALDAEEAELLVAAKRVEVHKYLGYGSFAEYLGRVCGYAPGTVRDRMRVAEALEGLPAMREALSAGMITYSTVRELTRFVDGETEEDWIVAVEGCTAREVEELARGREAGDLPDDRPHADLEPRRLRLDLLPPDYALFLEARAHLQQLTGEQLTDADFMRVACRAVLGGSARSRTAEDDGEGADAGRDAGEGADAGAAAGEGADAGAAAGNGADAGRGAGEDADAGAAAGNGADAGAGAGNGADAGRGAGRGAGEGADAGAAAGNGAGRGGASAGNQPPHQIAVTVCANCKRGWHETGGQSLELTPAHVERMRCDAMELGRVDGDVIAERVRTIPAAMRRAVLARDRHRCTVPGCTSSLFVDVHHLHPWSQGGEHTMSNLTTLCTLHHDLAHHGRIVISGSSGALVVLHADGRPYGMLPAAPTPHVGRAPATSDSSGATPHVGRAPAPSASSAAARPHVGRAPATSDSSAAEPPHVGRAPATSASSAAARPHVGREPATSDSSAAEPPHVGRAGAAAGARTRSAHGADGSTSRARVPGAQVPAKLVEEARMALTGLGFRSGQATAAVAEATLQVSAGVTLEQLVRAALVACQCYLRS